MVDALFIQISKKYYYVGDTYTMFTRSKHNGSFASMVHVYEYIIYTYLVTT